MKYIHFDWDDNKEKQNIKKHGISFSEAKTCFFDEKARVLYDSKHSDNEGMGSPASVCFHGKKNLQLLLRACSKPPISFAFFDKTKTWDGFWIYFYGD